MLPLLALLEENLHSAFQLLPAYFFAAIAFIIGAWRLLRQKQWTPALAVAAALTLTFCFWNEAFKSPVIARTSVGGDMTDFQGELILRRNGDCEIRQSTIFDSYRYNGTYNICKNIIFIKGCGDVVKEFDTISIQKNGYLIFKDD